MNAFGRWFVVALLAVAVGAWALPPGAAAEPESSAAAQAAQPSGRPLPPAPTPQEAARQLHFDRRSPVVQAVGRVKDAVVNISSTRLVRVSFGGFDDEMFERLFGGPDPFSRTVKTTSLGSGVVIHPSGYVLTNAHVVARATEVTCSFTESETFSARLISTDAPHDLAVLKIESPRPLPFLPMGRSDDLLIGETVIAIGNAMGYSHTVTTGVVSAVNRHIQLTEELALNRLIQTDASINPGNSGGPLLNINGELIGINTAIRGDAQNIGFAIPIDAARDELAFLLDFARVRELQFGARLEDKDGLRVAQVDAGSPAAAGGLAVGDVVLSVDGVDCPSLMEFNVAMLEKAAGQTCRFQVRRPDRPAPAELKVQLLAKPRPDGNALLWAHFGMKVRPVDADLARQLRLRAGVGLVLTQMNEDSPAAQAGLQVGDLLIQVDTLYVNSLDDLGQALKSVQPEQVLRLGFLRGRFQVYVRMKAK